MANMQIARRRPQRRLPLDARDRSPFTAVKERGQRDAPLLVLGHGHDSARSSTQSTYNRRSENSHAPSVNLIWKKDNSSPVLHKFVAQVEAQRITARN
jgi:hypothetical protein